MWFSHTLWGNKVRFFAMYPFLPVSRYFFLSLLKFSTLQQSFTTQRLCEILTICRVKLWHCPSRSLSCCQRVWIRGNKGRKAEPEFTARYVHRPMLPGGLWSHGESLTDDAIRDLELWLCCLLLQPSASKKSLPASVSPIPMACFWSHSVAKCRVTSLNNQRLSLGSF